MLDLKNPAIQQDAMEAFFFGYQAFTSKPDEILARRGLSRVHHRILFFIAKYPGLSVKELLGYQDVRNYDGSWTEWGSVIGAPIDNPSAGK